MSQNRISTDVVLLCPDCGKTLKGHVNLHGLPISPEPGDITFCICCGLIMSFDDNGGARPGTNAEYTEMRDILGSKAVEMIQKNLDVILHPGRWDWQNKNSLN